MFIIGNMTALLLLLVAGEEKPAPAALRPGLSPAEVTRLLGKPKRVARQILYRRYLEQWVYDAPTSLRLEFDCPRGQAPKLVTFQPLVPAKP